MKTTLMEMIALADEERNLDLLSLIGEILDRFIITGDCPSNWRSIGRELAEEYPEDSWVYENLELEDYLD